jgi:translocation and assembly module TamA
MKKKLPIINHFDMQSNFSRFLILLFILLSFSSFAKIDIKISGVNDEIRNNILAFLGNEKIDCEASEGIKNAFLNGIPSKVLKATRPFGYYKAKANINQETNKNNCLSLKMGIDLGPSIIIRKLEVIINADDDSKKVFNEIINKSTLAKGKTLIHSDYEDLKFALSEFASENGYLDAKFNKNKIDIFIKDYAADISLIFETGTQYKIEKIDIVQTPVFLDQRFIKNMIALNVNGHFSKTQLYKIRKNLMATSYFNQVTVELNELGRNNGKVPIIITLTPGDRIKYSAGIGFSTDAGPRIGLDYSHFRLSDFGYQLNSKLSLSEIISEFSTGIKIPSKSRALNKWSNIDLGYRVERSDNVTSNTSKLGFSQTRIHVNKWQNINYIDLINERFETGNISNESILLVPGTSWSFVKADNPTLPTEGFKIQTDIKGASNSLASDSSFVQIGLSIKAITSLGDNHRFIARTDLGSTYSNDFDDLPTSYRFYAGGDKSIRGYNYQELGPANSDGDIIGGKHLAVASFEYEYRLKGAWAGALFADMGNAFTDDFKLEKSVGAGIRWFSPIGPVRLDVGVPINGVRDFKIHITLGPDL